MGVIYCYTNLLNNKRYIGQTINDEYVRRAAHKSAAFNESDLEYDSPLHRAFRKYGYESFKYEILANYIEDVDLLNQLEIYYISYFNSVVPNGYNIEPGGKNCLKPMAEETKDKLRWMHGALSEQEVIELRIAYQNKESPRKIYEEKYKDRITHYNSFLNIWDGKRYATVMPEVFQKGRHRKLNADKVHLMKKDRRENNLSYDTLAEKYGVSKSTVSDIFNGRTWKNVQ